MIGLNNINFNPTTYLNITEKLQKDNNPPDPIALGLKNFADYKHVDHLEILAENGQGGFPLQNITVDYRIQKSKKNIQSLKDSGETCYFLNHQNPYVGILKSNGQFIWGSIDVSSAPDAFEITKFLSSKNQTVHINMGTHGDNYGNMSADGDNYGDGMHVEHLVKELKGMDRVAFDIVNKSRLPRYPETANHVINKWCGSIKSSFTSVYHTMHPLDQKGVVIPSELRCIVSNKIMQSPYFFESCQKLDGRVHYYDITSIAKLINQRLLLDKPIGSIEDLKKKTPQDIVAEYVNQDQDFKKWYRDNKRMIIKCRLSECRGDIDLEKAVFSESLMKTLEMFNENIEKRNNEINQLTVEKRLDKLNIQNLEIKNGEKDIKIGGLENENSDLKGRVTVLTEENSSQEQRLDQFVDLVKDQRKTIESREKQIVQLKKDPEYKTIKEMITGNALFARYSRKDWNKKTSEQRKDAEYWLMLILKGRTLERHNAFVTQNTLENHDEHHRKVFENFLNGREQQVISSVRNSMKYLSFDLVDTFIIGEYQIRYNDQEFDLFLKPIMERIFSEGRVLDRITNITKDQQVYIQNFPSEEWDRKESNRAFPLTYQETLSSISSRVLKLELCDQITRSIS